MLGINHEAQRVSPGVVRGVKEEYGEKHGKVDKGTPFREQRRIYKRSFPTVMLR